MNCAEAKKLGIGQAIEIERPCRVAWRRVVNEPLQAGDMWASADPNDLCLQQGGYYNLQMQAINVRCYGKLPRSDPYTNLGNGDYWRPMGLVPLTQTEMLVAATPLDD